MLNMGMVDLNGKKVLVTGGCGFIGSNFIDHVFKNYKQVELFNIDKMGKGSRVLYEEHSPLTKNVESIHLPGQDNFYSLWEMDLIELEPHCIPMRKFDYVFHFAAESHVDRSIDSPISFIENNVLGITCLLDWVRKNSPNAKVINVSTDEVYGHLGLEDAPFTENSPIAPRSPYSASKASADLIAKSYVETFRMDIITTRCCNNFGPHQDDEKFIPTIIRHLMNNEKVPVYGTGQNIREWIHVDDHNKSILEIVEIGESGKVYNIGSCNEFTNLEIISIILSILEVDLSESNYIEFVEDRKGHDYRYALKSLYYERNFQMRDFYEALEETVNFYSEKYEKV